MKKFGLVYGDKSIVTVDPEGYVDIDFGYLQMHDSNCDDYEERGLLSTE